MIKGLAITPPILGRISIGRIVERNGKRLPEKDDQITLTSQVQSKDDGWLPHPLDEGFRKAQGGKIRVVPVRFLFNDPDLNFRATYSLFDRTTGRPFCVGNGESCKRQTEEGLKTMPCPSPEACLLAKGGNCKPYGRLNVMIGEDDPLGSFIFRTTGFNSIRTLIARLQYFQAISGNRLSCLPLELRLRGKSTRKSHGTPIYYMDITLRSGMTLMECLAEGKQNAEMLDRAGFNQEALEIAARAGFSNGAFVEESEEDLSEVVEEFYSSTEGVSQGIEGSHGDTQTNATNAGTTKPSLIEKLDRKVMRMGKENNFPVEALA